MLHRTSRRARVSIRMQLLGILSCRRLLQPIINGLRGGQFARAYAVPAVSRQYVIVPRPRSADGNAAVHGSNRNTPVFCATGPFRPLTDRNASASPTSNCPTSGNRCLSLALLMLYRYSPSCPKHALPTRQLLLCQYLPVGLLSRSYPMFA